MKNLLLFISVITFLLTCDSPNTGISSNPNFVNGTILFEDETPVVNAYVAFQHQSDISSDTTDTNGNYSVQSTLVIQNKKSVVKFYKCIGFSFY